jgi:hypothetical protein
MVVKNTFYDPDSQLVGEHFAVVYAPVRKRARFPENCVQLMAGEAEALQAADAQKHLYPGKVLGPSRSSEGVCLYYLVDWL